MKGESSLLPHSFDRISLHSSHSSFDSTTIMKPIAKRLFGAVLFADISGFTRLSARLGSEELKLHIK